DHRDLWDDIAIANGTKSLSNDFYSSDYYTVVATQPGYIYNSKNGTKASLQIPTFETPAKDQKYRITASMIIGSEGQTALNIRAGRITTIVESFVAAETDGRIVQVTDYIYTVPSGAVGKRMVIEALMTGAPGGKGGGGVGFIHLKVERL
ncbi:hypothetical protein, partial [uncultured Roseobacter sp.]|uniref:hypothetical protein n=1 Tax=uncultured Roseobacter sp. TaxID=114847 RepID=UPI00261BC20F